MGGGLVWVDYEVSFTADEAQAKAALDYLTSLSSDEFEYAPEDLALSPGRDAGTWRITYGAESYEEGPAEALNEQFPDLNAVGRITGEHYD